MSITAVKKKLFFLCDLMRFLKEKIDFGLFKSIGSLLFLSAGVSNITQLIFNNAAFILV